MLLILYRLFYNSVIRLLFTSFPRKLLCIAQTLATNMKVERKETMKVFVMERKKIILLLNWKTFDDVNKRLAENKKLEQMGEVETKYILIKDIKAIGLLHNY